MTKSIDDYTLEEAMQKIEDALNENPNLIEGFNAVYQYDITGDDGGTYQLHLKEGAAKVFNGAETEADCVLTLSEDNFKQMLLGKLNGTVAFMSGKLKIKGDIGKAIKMEGLLRQYNVNDYL
ncbi:SCP2 sterol-binding domain-containing protein [Bacillus sp. FJAT-49736]|uniref:SCP2 sterol-binding domain-containing protein n=1 Tax=Bacillus sp. FJAT-49736 TaxID=2833582 RepID=UPI001BC93D90|nr:SCP2 sterol-binding domain-containing protein [Bacillus sp. FJAT-49736]MBS4172903.1 SCP2 sterol-binding domain-containing protein [Bacillus sp. FJAT-49736]